MKTLTSILLIILSTPGIFAIDPPKGNSLYFDGSDVYVDLGKDTLFQNLTTHNFTIEMMVKTTDVGRIFLIGNHAGVPPYIDFEISSRNGGGTLCTKLNGSDFRDDTSVSDGFWHHVATVVDFDNDYVKMYLDGAETYSAVYTDTAFTGDKNMYLAGTPTSPHSQSNFVGYMDEIRIWNYARPADSISANINISYSGKEEGLVAYYNCNESLCTDTLVDLASGNSGIFINGYPRVNHMDELSAPHSLFITNITYNSLQLNWRAPLVGKPDYYLLEIDNSSDFSTPEVSETLVDELTYIVNGLSYSNRYYFRIRAVNNAHENLSCTKEFGFEIDNSWVQLGLDIDGYNAMDLFGRAVSLNSDGSIVAIGALASEDSNDEGVLSEGYVRIFQYDTINTSWVQLGTDIYGEALRDASGSSLSLSSDGLAIAIGAPGNDGNGNQAGHVRVFGYDPLYKDWVQLGTAIDGEDAEDYSGISVSLSSDASVLAIGAPSNDGNGERSGHVRIFRYDPLSTDWVQLGADIDGETAKDESGYTLSLDSAGLVVAIGAPNNDGNGSEAGQVRIFQFDTISTNWVQLGSDIHGEVKYDRAGYAVSLSSDGSKIAIGAPSNDGNGTDAGQVRIFRYDSLSTDWVQLGADIDGVEGDYSGKAVSLSSDGSRVAIGAQYNDGNGKKSGLVRIFQFDSISTGWVQYGTAIHGEAAADGFGSAVSLCSNGTVVVIGATGYNLDEFSTFAGYAKVYGVGIDSISMPVDIKGCPHSVVQLPVYARNALWYQWQVGGIHESTWFDLSDNAMYSGTSSDTLSIICDTSMKDNRYRCLISNLAGTITGNAVKLLFDPELILVSLPDLSDECAIDEPTAPTALSACNEVITATTLTKFPITEQGVSVITWIYDDGYGNVVSQHQQVHIEDLTEPVITCAGNQTIDITSGQTTYKVSGSDYDPITAYDNCQIASVTNDLTNSATLDGAELPIGTTVILWSVEDIAGKIEFCANTITVNVSSDIQELEQFGISVYPNPVLSYLNIDFENDNVQQLIITDLAGRMLLEKTTVQQQETIDMSGYIQGVYVLRVMVEDRLLLHKLIKQY